jgi:hypothetical protein
MRLGRSNDGTAQPKLLTRRDAVARLLVVGTAVGKQLLLGCGGGLA